MCSLSFLSSFLCLFFPLFLLSLLCSFLFPYFSSLLPFLPSAILLSSFFIFLPFSSLFFRNYPYLFLLLLLLFLAPLIWYCCLCCPVLSQSYHRMSWTPELLILGFHLLSARITNVHHNALLDLFYLEACFLFFVPNRYLHVVLLLSINIFLFSRASFYSWWVTSMFKFLWQFYFVWIFICKML